MPAPAQSVISALGFPRAAARLYEQVRQQSGRPLDAVAAQLRRTPEELRRDLEALLDGGLAQIGDDGVLQVLPPVEAVSAFLRDAADSAATAHRRLEDVVRAIPHLSSAPVRPPDQDVGELQPLDGEISTGGDPLSLLHRLITEGSGDLLWLRPDQWRPPAEDLMADVVAEVLASGRRSRAIYPVRALAEAPATLAHRAGLGEEIRLLPDLPTRMLVLGPTHAILPEPLGFEAEPRSLIRQRGLVQALTLWFDALWQRAAPLPVDVAPDDPRNDLRQFILEQLAVGAQDDQIARLLGVSLRTVRRRVADVMAELGAESRFQAGVEAVRRGWL